MMLQNKKKVIVKAGEKILRDRKKKRLEKQK